MHNLFKLQSRAFDFWCSSLTATTDSMITIASRLPIIAQSGGNPLQQDPELTRMISEKMDAAYSSMMSSAAPLMTLSKQMSSGSSPIAIANAAFAVAEAYTKPGYKKVAANARRFEKQARGKTTKK